TTAHLKSSPMRADRSGIPLGDLVPSPPSLSPDPGRNIRINPPPGECVSVGKFDVRVDYDRPNAARGFAQEASSGDTSEQTTGAPEDALDGDAQPVRTWTDSDRQVL